MARGLVEEERNGALGAETFVGQGVLCGVLVFRIFL